MWPILKIDARTQIEAAPDEQTEMRCRSANQSLITDVFALRPYFCTIQLQPIRTAMQCGARLLRPQPLTGDIRDLLSELSTESDPVRTTVRRAAASASTPRRRGQ